MTRCVPASAGPADRRSAMSGSERRMKPVRRTTPTRSRSCCGGRSRWARRPPRGWCRRSRRPACSRPGSGPARRSSGARRLARAQSPHGKVLALEAASRRVLPLRLGGKPLSAPGAERAGVGPRDVHHGMLGRGLEGRSAAPPAGASSRRTPAATRGAAATARVGGSRPEAGRRRRTTTRTARLRSRTRSGRQSGRRARSSRRSFRCGTGSTRPRGPALRRRRDRRTGPRCRSGRSRR